MAIAIEGGHILSLRSSPDNAAAHSDLYADRITAGLVDAHAHPEGLGRRLSELDLTDAPTYRETLARVKAASKSPNQWLRGRGWDQNDWPDAPAGSWPLATDLDAQTGEIPTVLFRIDGHAAWLNTAALIQSGITRDTPEPEGGQIVRDAKGEATGVLIDGAMHHLQLPAPKAGQRSTWILRGTEAMAESGLTGTHAMGMGDASVQAFQALDAKGSLPIRIWAYVSPGTEAAKHLLRDGPSSGNHFQIVGIKAFADGALGSRGALLSADYADADGHRGLVQHTQEELTSLATQCLAVEAQLAVHAIGDAGVRNALDAFAAARASHPDKAHIPLRIEHAQVVHPDDIPRFKALNVIASMQPTHATSDMPWAQARLGPERITWAYRWRTLKEAGAKLAFGSDAPVEDVAPHLGLWAATTRTDRSGEPQGGWQPDQVLTQEEALDAFTVGAASALPTPSDFGRLGEGAPADLTLWSHSTHLNTKTLTPVATIVNGKVVWQAKSAPNPPAQAD